jgi:tripartite-type tricarboxylate transporter receptor subunit TctC
LIAREKAEPGKLNYASSGVGGGTHLPGLLFTKTAGVDIVHVPYKGGAPAIQGIVSGDTQLSFATPPSVLPFARAGRLKVIAVTSGKRSPLFPDLPTVAEGGVPGYDYTFWFGLFGPKGLPEDIRTKFAAAVGAYLNTPEAKAKLATNAYIPTPEGPESVAAVMKKETDALTSVIQKYGIKKQPL